MASEEVIVANDKVQEAFTLFYKRFEDIKSGDVTSMNDLIKALTDVQTEVGKVGQNDPAKGNELAEGPSSPQSSRLGRVRLLISPPQ